jgi:hypothetical protein
VGLPPTDITFELLGGLVLVGDRRPFDILASEATLALEAGLVILYAIGVSVVGHMAVRLVMASSPYEEAGMLPRASDEMTPERRQPPPEGDG